MIVPFLLAVAREVLLDHDRTARDGGDGYEDVALVPRISDQTVPRLAQTIHVGQTHVLEGSWIGRIAVQQHELRPAALEQLDRLTHLRFRRHAGRADQRFARARQMAEQIVIGQVSRGDLVGWEPVLLQLVHARGIPGCTQRNEPPCPAVIKRREERFVGELESAQQVQGVLGTEVLRRIIALDLIAVEHGHVAHLELRAVRTGLGREIDELQRFVETAVVVVADLGNDEGRPLLVDDAIANANTTGQFAAKRHGAQTMLRIDEREEVDLFERVRDLLCICIDAAYSRSRLHDAGNIDVEARRGIGQQPAIKVTGCEGADKAARIVDAEQHAQTAGVELRDRLLERCAGAHEPGRQVVLENHLRSDRSATSSPPEG